MHPWTFQQQLFKLLIHALTCSQGLLVAILYCFVNKEVSLILFFIVHNLTKMASSSHICILTILCIFLIGQVQSEILKKWRRWKLGRDIEEEYRHTYSQSLQMKSGSIMVPPSNLSRLPDIATTTSRLGSPEEKQMLVSNSQNGMGTGLQFTSTPQDSSTCSSITEDIVMVDREKCCSVQQDNAKSSLWALDVSQNKTLIPTTLASSGWESWSKEQGVCVWVCESTVLSDGRMMGTRSLRYMVFSWHCPSQTGSAVSRRWTYVKDLHICTC